MQPYPHAVVVDESDERAVAEVFAPARVVFEGLVGMLGGPSAAAWSHAELEDRVVLEGRELTRLLLQANLDLRAARERRVERVVGADGVVRRRAERGHHRALQTLVGPVRVERIAYRAPGVAALCPADAVLGLPVEKHSHGLRRLAALEAVRGSYADAHEALWRSCGISVGKRQLEQLTARAAVDVDAFYTHGAQDSQGPRPAPRPCGDPLVMSVDGKGIVMRPEGLRAKTRRAAAAKTAAGGNKLATRLTGGEKSGRKRMAEVGAVYEIIPVPRTPADVITIPTTNTPTPPPTTRPPSGSTSNPSSGPVAQDKWLTASITSTATQVITEVFNEAQRRDPTGDRTWLMLADGARYQLDAITAEITRRGQTVHIIIDFIHVLEYLWKAAWCLHPAADPAAESWVAQHALKILEGNAAAVATNLDEQATRAALATTARRNLDRAVTYLTNKAPYLRYDQALAAGWPIATGVIEGACRHLVKDRMDITGARWSLQGAEAILKLRTLTSNNDFDQYWAYHQTREHHRNHQTRYQTTA